MNRWILLYLPHILEIHEIEDYMGRRLSCIIELCGDARISSTQLLETLEQRFDKDTLLKIVKFEDVADSYGLAEMHEWGDRLHSRI